MKRIYFNLFLLLLFMTGNSVLAQKQSKKENGKQPKDFFISTYQFHPHLLKKNAWLIDFSTEIPKFYKYYNPKLGKIAPKMPVVVLNEAYFNAHFLYGLNANLNLYVNLPFKDFHHYSPMMFQKGVGFGDLQTGVVYGNLLGEPHHLTLEAQINWPTGIYKHDMQTLNTGTGAFGFQVGLNGLENLQPNKHDAWEFAYHAYYNYLVSTDNIDKGMETGATALFRKPFHTHYGYFGLENAFNFQYHSPYKAGQKTLPNTELTQFDVSIGGWYQFLNNFYLRLSVPYTLYQNQAYLTKYSVVIQLDYKFN